MEAELEQQLDILNPSGPVLPRLLKALKELAQTDERLATVLRSFSLLQSLNNTHAPRKLRAFRFP